jgi:hypothetical protein
MNNRNRSTVVTEITIVLACMAFCFAGCKKDTVHAPTSFTMYIVNAGINSKIQTNFTNAGVVIYNNRGQYLVQSDQQVSIADTTALSTPLINTSYSYDKGVYTVFVAGQSPTFEAILKDETDLPFIPNDKIYSSTDSVVNVRFINLSPNSVPLKIKVSTSATNEADALAFKEITTWRPFKATASTTAYSIQIRNASTDALVTSYSFVCNATNRFKNVTLMVRGLQGTTSGANAFGVTSINYF